MINIDCNSYIFIWGIILSQLNLSLGDVTVHGEFYNIFSGLNSD